MDTDACTNLCYRYRTRFVTGYGECAICGYVFSTDFGSGHSPRLKSVRRIRATMKTLFWWNFFLEVRITGSELQYDPLHNSKYALYCT